MAVNAMREGDHEKVRLRRLPNIFSSTFLRCSKRERKGKESVVTGNHSKVLPKQKGEDIQKVKAFEGNEEVKNRTASSNIQNVHYFTSRALGVKTLATTETQGVANSDEMDITIPSDMHAALLSVLGLRPVRKNSVMLIPQQKKNVNLDGHHDDEMNQISVAASTLKTRQVHCLTSVLSPRSEIACEISENSNQQIDEIDLPDVNNHLAVVEYVQDLYSFYKQQQHVHRPIDYTHMQPHIKPNTRANLVDWIIEVHYTYKLMPETLYLTIHIIDRYLSQDSITRKQLKLVGVCAMLIASKYEETFAPQVNDFMEISLNVYSKEEILGMEKLILDKLEWYLTVPTAYMFLVRYIKVAKADQELEHMIYFFAELGLMLHDLIKYCPSIVAAAAVYTAHCTLGKTPLWTDALEHHTSFSESELLDCAQLLVRAHCAVPGSKLKVVYQKYMLPEFGSVARYPPAMSLIEVSESGAHSESC